MEKLERFLVGVDFSPRSRTAVDMAVAIARPVGASIEVMHVIESRPTDLEAQILGREKAQIEKTITDEAQNELNSLIAQLDYDKLSTMVSTGNAAEQLTRRYSEMNADVLFIGDTGAQSVAAFWGPGVTAYRLVERGPERVMVVKPSYRGQVSKIAAAIDFSPVSEDVLKQSALIAKATGANLRVVHMFSTTLAKRLRQWYDDDAVRQALDQLADENKKQLQDFVRSHKPLDAPAQIVVLPGSVTTSLAGYLQDEAVDLVVVGTGTSPRIAGYPIGSATHALLRQTLASVFVVRSRD